MNHTAETNNLRARFPKTKKSIRSYYLTLISIIENKNKVYIHECIFFLLLCNFRKEIIRKKIDAVIIKIVTIASQTNNREDETSAKM